VTRRVALLALLLPCLASADTGIELVVDASASMGEPLEGARTRLAAVRAALTSVMVALPVDDPTVAVGLRVSGGEVPWSEADACQDSVLVVAPAPSSTVAVLEALAGLQPGGADLPARSIAGAAEDLAGFDGQRLVVVVTDGDAGGCEGDWGAAAEALEASTVELWVVGGGLGESAAAVAERAHLEPAATSAELQAAVVKAVGSALALDSTPREVTLRLHRGGTPVQLDATALVDLGGVRRELSPVEGSLRGEAPPGLYEVALVEPEGSTWTLAGLRVVAGAPTGVDLELPAPEEVRLEAPDGTVSIREGVTVRYAGARPGSSALTVVPHGTPAGDLGPNRVSLGQVEGEAVVEVPERAGAAEVRLHLEAGAGATLLAARTLLPVRPLEEPLEVASEVEVGEAVEVAWRGRVVPGDCVAMVPAGAGDARPESCLPVAGAEPVLLDALESVGPAQVRFVSGRSGRFLAQSPIEVVPARPRLVSPGRVMAGEAFEVPWSWREEPGPYDYLAVATAEAAEGAYVSFVPTAAGPVARLRAPAEPGEYEVRYVSGRDDRTLAAAAIEVTTPAVTVSGPPEVVAGTRVTVTWTGPDRTGDVVVVAPAGAGAGRMTDWEYTSAGSPLTVAAPERPGEYELRYVSGGRVLATAKLVVLSPR